MKCIQCGFDNEAREEYCRACGMKVQVSLEDVEADLISKADRQMEEATELEIRRWLIVSICLFLLALTAKVFYGPATWPKFYAVPSSSLTADYTAVTYKHEVPLMPLPAPIPD
jgi:uncharacterized membrane protein YvbJ